MKISVISPVKNEAQFIGYSLMAVLPYVTDIVYTVAPSSDDGTIELLEYIKGKYAGDKLTLLVDKKYDFHPHDTKAYNESYNDAIQASKGDAVWFLHADMIVTNPEIIPTVSDGPLAWWTEIVSYAGNLETVITQGRTKRWKNIHAKKFGLHYFGGYGSVNEDFYHSDITGRTYVHYGDKFSDYPFEVAESGIKANHYCEVKPYKRRLEKMKLCLKTQYPTWPDGKIEEMAVHHPRVVLEPSASKFGRFEFDKAGEKPPEVFNQYGKEFEELTKENLCPAATE